MHKYRAAVIGAGNIGAGTGVLASNLRNKFNHAFAYSAHPHIDLVGFYDADDEKVQKAILLWGGKPLTFEEAASCDIVSICTPDGTHGEVLQKIIRHKPKLIIVEKPLDAQCRVETDIPILVNFPRRFALEKFKGEAIAASGIYCKGLEHNGSHMIDTARLLFGEVKNILVAKKARDGVSAILELERCPQFHLMVGDASSYYIFDLDIFYRDKRVRLVDLGHRAFSEIPAPNARYPHVKTLQNPVSEETGLDKSMERLIENAVQHLENGEPLLCNLAEALKTQKVCEELARSNLVCQN